MSGRNIVIVLGRCGRLKQPFAIRFERREPDEWSATWAFAIQDAVAGREGYADTRIAGRFVLDEAYPGCPHCRSRGFFRCACGKLACWDGQSQLVACPTCGHCGRLTEAITSLAGGGKM